jgi:four helix bundle protein
MSHRDLNVLDSAQRLADLVNEMIDGSPRGRLLHVRQLRDAVQSIAADISEGLGRGAGRDRDRSLAIARGEAEEAISTCELSGKPDRAEGLLAASQPARRDREDVDVAAGVVTAMGACNHVAAPLRVHRLPGLRRSSVPLLPSGSCVVWVVRRSGRAPFGSCAVQRSSSRTAQTSASRSVSMK